MTIRVYCESDRCDFEEKCKTEKEAKEVGRNHTKQGHVIGFEKVKNGGLIKND